ncbi:helix-turn-helix domain-containing protein [Methanocaldococcus sp. 28A]
MGGVKLDDKKIKKIIRWKEKGFRTKDIAKKLEISTRRVQQIWKEYRETGEIPNIKRRCRKPREITQEEIDIVLKAVEEYKRTSPGHLEHFIECRYNMHNNRIYTILKQYGEIQPKKEKLNG